MAKLHEVMPNEPVYKSVPAALLAEQEVAFVLHSARVVDTRFGTRVMYTLSDISGALYALWLAANDYRLALGEAGNNTPEGVGPVKLVTVRRKNAKYDMYLFREAEMSGEPIEMEARAQEE